MIDVEGLFTEEFRDGLPEMLGDDYYNDPTTKQQPTKMFDDVHDIQTMTRNYAKAQRQISKGEAAFTERLAGMVKLPTAEDGDDVKAAYREKAGIPTTSDGYELAIPKEDSEGYEAIAKEVRAAAHEFNIPGEALKGLWGKVLGGLETQVKAIETAGAKLMEVETEQLTTKYKEKLPSFLKTGDDALGKFKNGPAVSELLKKVGLANNPAIRELLVEMAPLVLEGGSFFGASPTDPDGNIWPTNYEYDADGRPI